MGSARLREWLIVFPHLCVRIERGGVGHRGEVGVSHVNVTVPLRVAERLEAVTQEDVIGGH